MTAMPQMVALFNGVGGGAAALVSLAEFHNLAPEPGQPARRHLARDRALGADRLGLVRRLDGRVREAPGADLGPADHLPRPADREPASARRRLVAVRRRDRRRLRAAVGARGADPRRARLRRAVRAADRRRRHAGRDLAPERVHRPRGRRDRLRARLERADRERRARRRLGNAADDDDGPGDEPLARERALRRVRAGAGRRRDRRGARGHGALGDRRGRRDHALLRAEGRDRPRLRDGGRAGPARGARARRRARVEGDRGRPSRSTRSPGACRAT